MRMRIIQYSQTQNSAATTIRVSHFRRRLRPAFPAVNVADSKDLHSGPDESLGRRVAVAIDKRGRETEELVWFGYLQCSEQHGINKSEGRGRGADCQRER